MLRGREGPWQASVNHEGTATAQAEEPDVKRPKGTRRRGRALWRTQLPPESGLLPDGVRA